MPFALGRLPFVGRLLQRLGINAVPATGFFAANWSVGTLLAIFWIETVLLIAATAGVIVVHRRKTRKAGHWRSALSRDGKKRARATDGETFLGSFLGVMAPFTAAHGVFVAALAFLALPELTDGSAGVVATELATALPWMVVLVLIGLTIDLIGLGHRPFAWVERRTQRTLGRMLILHLTIVLGMFAMAVTNAPKALFAVFIALKLLMDLSSARPAGPSPETPPRIVGWIDRWIPAQEGKTFADHYREQVAEERRDEKANEAIWRGGEARGGNETTAQSPANADSTGRPSRL